MIISAIDTDLADGPRIATIPSANTKAGIASKTSTIRVTNISILPPMNPVKTPMDVPRKKAPKTAVQETVSDT